MLSTINNTTEEYRLEIMRQMISGKKSENGSPLMPVLTTPNGKMSLQVYAKTNEDLSFISRLNPKDTECLTVGSSLDQLLTLIMEGARTADLFDLNFFARDFFELKKQAILHLPYASAKGFLTYHSENKYFLHPFLFGRIKKYLSPFEEKFWSEVISSPNKMDFFRSDGASLGFAPYLQSKANFERLKSNLDGFRPTFFDLPFSKVSAIKKNYDIVLLSNINEWYKNQNDFINDLEKSRSLLTSNGIIQAGYVWGNPSGQRTYEALKNAYGKHIYWKRNSSKGSAIILEPFEGSAIKPTSQDEGENT